MKWYRFSVAHIWKFCALTYPVRWKWASSVQKIFHGHSLSTFMWARNSKAKVSLLLAGQKDTTPVHSYICKDRNAGCFVEFYALFSQTCPMFGQFPWIIRFHTTAQFLLQCCGQFFNYGWIISFPSSTSSISKEPIFSNFGITFNRPWTAIWPKPFLTLFIARNFFRAAGAPSLFL